MKNVKKFEEYEINEELDFTNIKKEFSLKLRQIDHVLRLQGKKSDQRKERIIFTEDELSKMNKDELRILITSMEHPRGRPW